MNNEELPFDELVLKYNNNITKSSEYHTWARAKVRCYNKHNQSYPNYGGRGITMCDRWLYSFENFINDLGLKPTAKHSLDRINNNGNYEPSNCRWATSKEQIQNRRTSINLELNGIKKPLLHWAKEYNFPYKILHQRIYRDGLSLKEALTKRKRKVRKNV